MITMVHVEFFVLLINGNHNFTVLCPCKRSVTQGIRIAFFLFPDIILITGIPKNKLNTFNPLVSNLYVFLIVFPVRNVP